jgi:hypothetical protein
MKLGVFAASALLGVATLTSPALADDGRGMLEMGRTQSSGSNAAMARMTVPTEAPQLQGDRPAAGMLPPPRVGPARSFSATPTIAPARGDDIQQSLRR